MWEGDLPLGGPWVVTGTDMRGPSPGLGEELCHIFAHSGTLVMGPVTVIGVSIGMKHLDGDCSTNSSRALFQEPGHFPHCVMIWG